MCFITCHETFQYDAKQKAYCDTQASIPLLCFPKVTSNGRRGRCQIYRQLRKNFPPKADKRCSSTTFEMTNLAFRETSRKECSVHSDVILSSKEGKEAFRARRGM